MMVLVDADDRETGVLEKLETHRRGLLHRAFSVIIWDAEGRQLLQKRATAKYHSGGLWTNACCGHPRPGEPVGQAAARRLEEEMGFVCPLAPLGTISYRADLDGGMTEHEIVHVFRGIHGGIIAPNPLEADGYQWCFLDDVQRDAAADPGRFSVWFRAYVAAEWPVALERPDAA
jgi:isopentenyl-diphosphate delta-isomerase